MHPGQAYGHPGMMQQHGGHPGMQMGGGYGHPQANQPMLALMPPGMNGGGYGQPPIAYGAHPSALPFAAASPGGQNSTFTQMRQAPKNAQNAPIFDVVEAAPVRAVEPTNYMQNGGQYGGQPEYQSFYGRSNAAQQARY